MWNKILNICKNPMCELQLWHLQAVKILNACVDVETILHMCIVAKPAFWILANTSFMLSHVST